MIKVAPLTFEDFNDLYIKKIEPLKKANPEYVRLDGKIGNGTRVAFAYFYYNNNKWKVDADTQFDKLKIAYDLFCAGKDPFVIIATKDGKGQCLVIDGQPKYAKKFYVYKVS